MAMALGACGSSGPRPGGSPAPDGGPADSHGTTPPDVEPAVNSIDPIGSIFEHRLALALTDSQVAKMVAVDKRFELSARPMRREMDSLRTVSHDWSGYRPEGVAPVDTLHLPPAARDSIMRLRDALAGVSARLQAQAKRSRAAAIDVLSLEQLTRLAALASPLSAAQLRSGTMRPGGGGRYAGAYSNTPLRSGTLSYPPLPDPLAGVTLSDSQRTKVDSIRAAFLAEARVLGEPRRTLVAPLRDLLRRQYDAIRDVLTPDQQAVFDRNRGPQLGPGPEPSHGQAPPPGGQPTSPTPQTPPGV